jgi:hypothetical protein
LIDGIRSAQKLNARLGKGRQSMADYYPVIAHAVSRLPSNADEARHAIYQRARTALQETLCTFDPAVSANEEAALENAITKVETDLLLNIMRRFVREETAFSPPGLSFSSRAWAFVHAVTTKLIDLNRPISQRAVDGLTKFFLENTNGLKRLFDFGIRPLLR